MSQFLSYSDASLPGAEGEAAVTMGNVLGEEGAAAAEGDMEGSGSGSHMRELEDGVLSRNLGVPIIVVCTKVGRKVYDALVCAPSLVLRYVCICGEPWYILGAWHCASFC